jgi:hypothetical protein
MFYYDVAMERLRRIIAMQLASGIKFAGLMIRDSVYINGGISYNARREV